ncbi:hypothetical protein E2C01_097757 [Portunus trituberculatus]|uniref:Uncharacterized protein n=1 Tax=Portunus trituberculatus TaxID=210409 RepID=A0A5B7K173_PORTR|nr:hypothetical protein [Portunus trituberculatus]
MLQGQDIPQSGQYQRSVCSPGSCGYLPGGLWGGLATLQGILG